MKREWIGSTSTPSPALLEKLLATEKYHIETFIHVPDFPHDFNPSGLVPYPCIHGVATKPARYPKTRYMAQVDADGNELPPWGALSWGRAKYLRISAFGGRVTRSNDRDYYTPYADAKCPLCEGKPAPEDFYMTADGFDLRAPEEITL